MSDYSKPYRGVQFFGHWAEESADHFGRRDAMAVLADAVGRCVDQDMRTDEVRGALDYLSSQTTRPSPVKRFRKALDLPDPITRRREAEAAYRALASELGAAPIPGEA